MPIAQSVRSVLDTQVPSVLANGAIPTEQQLKEAYRLLMLANSEHTKRGLEFGRMCYQVQQNYKAQGRAGEGFKARLRELGIVERTAYRWIRKHKKRELSATWHEVESNQPKKQKAKPAIEGNNLQLPFDLPDNYPRKQWDEDVEILGGYRTLTKLLVKEFVPKVREKAAELRRAQAQTASVH